jgi:hypothetical protein
VTSGAVDLANIDAMTNATKAKGARLTAAFFSRLAAYGKELRRQCRPRIVFDCRMANDPAMMSSTFSAHACNSLCFLNAE